MLSQQNGSHCRVVTTICPCLAISIHKLWIITCHLFLCLDELKVSRKAEKIIIWKVERMTHSWNLEKNSLMEHTFTYNCHILFANNYVIFKVSWSDQFWKWTVKLKWQVLCKKITLSKNFLLGMLIFYLTMNSHCWKCKNQPESMVNIILPKLGSKLEHQTKSVWCVVNYYQPGLLFHHMIPKETQWVKTYNIREAA